MRRAMTTMITLHNVCNIDGGGEDGAADEAAACVMLTMAKCEDDRPHLVTSSSPFSTSYPSPPPSPQFLFLPLLRLIPQMH
jgi:hypothetical protein